MDRCPNCGVPVNKLSEAGGRCMKCGKPLPSNIKTNSAETNSTNNTDSFFTGMNKIGAALIICGISDAVIGTLASIVNGIIEKSFFAFIELAFTSLFSALLLFGFAEIINILDSIRNKMN